MSPRDQPPLQNHVGDDQQPLQNAATDDEALASDTESVPGANDPAPAAVAGDADTDADLCQIAGMINATNAAPFAASLASVMHQIQTSNNSLSNNVGNHTSSCGGWSVASWVLFCMEFCMGLVLYGILWESRAALYEYMDTGRVN